MELITASEARKKAIIPEYLEKTIEKINIQIKNSAESYKHSTTIKFYKDFFFNIRDILHLNGYEVKVLNEDELYILISIEW